MSTLGGIPEPAKYTPDNLINASGCRVAAAAAAVGDALAVLSNCTLRVSHSDDGSSLRTIHP